MGWLWESSIEFNIGHLKLLKGLKEEALKRYKLGIKNTIGDRQEKIKTIKEDFKLLSEVYPEKVKEFKEMEETLIDFVEKK